MLISPTFQNILAVSCKNTLLPRSKMLQLLGRCCFHALFSFPGSAAGKIVSTLSISSGSGTTPTATGQQPAPHQGDGFGKISFWFFNAGFLDGFPDRHKITAETAENGGRGGCYTPCRKGKEKGRVSPPWLLNFQIFRNYSFINGTLSFSIFNTTANWLSVQFSNSSFISFR